MKRRDLLQAERLVGKPAGKMFRQGVPTAELALALEYIQARRDGDTDASFEVWLDEDWEWPVEPDDDDAVDEDLEGAADPQ